MSTLLRFIKYLEPLPIFLIRICQILILPTDPYPPTRIFVEKSIFYRNLENTG